MSDVPARAQKRWTELVDAINAARAVGTMKETGAGRKVVAIGWSQGGGATIAAAGQPEALATVIDRSPAPMPALSVVSTAVLL